MSTGPYSGLSRVYDRLNADVDYPAWADYFEGMFARFAPGKITSVLDLGCGTGSMTMELARRGYDMTGVDCSADMLSVARERVLQAGLDGILLLEQDMRAFELYGTVSAVVCVLDGLNYLGNTRELAQVFALVNNYLDPGGLFLFDVNTPYKFRNVFADNAYVLEDEGIYCGWQNYFDPRRGVCSFYLSVFEEQQDGSWSRRDEEQRERCFSQRSIRTALAGAGLELCGLYGGFGGGEPAENCERWHFVARTKK